MNEMRIRRAASGIVAPHGRPVVLCMRLKTSWVPDTMAVGSMN